MKKKNSLTETTRTKETVKSSRASSRFKSSPTTGRTETAFVIKGKGRKPTKSNNTKRRPPPPPPRLPSVDGGGSHLLVGGGRTKRKSVVSVPTSRSPPLASPSSHSPSSPSTPPFPVPIHTPPPPHTSLPPSSSPSINHHTSLSSLLYHSPPPPPPPSSNSLSSRPSPHMCQLLYSLMALRYRGGSTAPELALYLCWRFDKDDNPMFRCSVAKALRDLCGHRIVRRLRRGVFVLRTSEERRAFRATRKGGGGEKLNLDGDAGERLVVGAGGPAAAAVMLRDRPGAVAVSLVGFDAPTSVELRKAIRRIVGKFRKNKKKEETKTTDDGRKKNAILNSTSAAAAAAAIKSSTTTTTATRLYHSPPPPPPPNQQTSSSPVLLQQPPPRLLSSPTDPLHPPPFLPRRSARQRSAPTPWTPPRALSPCPYRRPLHTTAATTFIPNGVGEVGGSWVSGVTGEVVRCLFSSRTAAVVNYLSGVAETVDAAANAVRAALEEGQGESKDEEKKMKTERGRNRRRQVVVEDHMSEVSSPVVVCGSGRRGSCGSSCSSMRRQCSKVSSDSGGVVGTTTTTVATRNSDVFGFGVIEAVYAELQIPGYLSANKKFASPIKKEQKIVVPPSSSSGINTSPSCSLITSPTTTAALVVTTVQPSGSQPSCMYSQPIFPPNCSQGTSAKLTRSSKRTTTTTTSADGSSSSNASSSSRKGSSRNRSSSSTAGNNNTGNVVVGCKSRKLERGSISTTDSGGELWYGREASVGERRRRAVVDLGGDRKLVLPSSRGMRTRSSVASRL
eukprot:GHVS01077588.1.p1 GENE.GHVS01077588.1~~GHVS01077588.1.p1  ORF type:complete len:787 (+),score=262.80 GHVS01077588.1:127-2487(+)